MTNNYGFYQLVSGDLIMKVPVYDQDVPGANATRELLKLLEPWIRLEPDRDVAFIHIKFRIKEGTATVISNSERMR